MSTAQTGNTSEHSPSTCYGCAHLGQHGSTMQEHTCRYTLSLLTWAQGSACHLFMLSQLILPNYDLTPMPMQTTHWQRTTQNTEETELNQLGLGWSDCSWNIWGSRGHSVGKRDSIHCGPTCVTPNSYPPCNGLWGWG